MFLASQYWGNFSSVMWSCATRSPNRNGPAQTGCSAKSAPSLAAALGETIMPDRSVSCATNGAEGCFSATRTVSGSTTSTWSTMLTSLRRKLPGRVRSRSRLYLTLAASIFSPSWNSTPGRRWISTVFGSGESYEVASIGTMFSFSSMSNSLSHIAV